MSETDIKRSNVLMVVMIISTFAVFVHAVAFLLFHHLNKPQAKQPVLENTFQRTVANIKGPMLQESNEQDLANLRKHEDETLNSYGWVDRSRGIIRIPVNRAMELMAAQGEKIK